MHCKKLSTLFVSAKFGLDISLGEAIW